jgi:hypothetical protein
MRQTVLVVDDHPSFRASARALFRSVVIPLKAIR